MTDTAPLAGELDSATPARSLLEKVMGRRQTYQKYSPSDLKKIAQKYLYDIGLGDDVSFGSKSFDNHVTERAKNFKELHKAKTPNDDLVFKKLSAPASNPAEQTAKDQVIQVINDALKTSEEFSKAQAKYSESATLFKELVQKTSQDHNVQDVIGVMEDLVEEGKRAIKQQQTQEIQSLKNQFSQAGFDDTLKKALNISTEQLEETKKSILDDLAETHQKQIDAFNKSTQESVRALHSAAAKQRQAFLFIASLHNNDVVMRREIEKYASESREAHGDTGMEILLGENRADVKSVNLDQLQFIQLLGGGKIEREKDEATGKFVEPITYKLEMGSKFFNPRYLGNDRHKRDMLVMAQAVRASGCTGITMTLNFSNQSTADQRARQAYDACIKAGFPPEKIKLVVNGKLMGHQAIEKDGKKYGSISEELYAKKQNKYNSLQEQSQKIRAELEGLTATPKGTSKTNMAAIKAELEQLREEARRRPAAAAEPEQGETIHMQRR
jgi:hypothetical protein